MTRCLPVAAFLAVTFSLPHPAMAALEKLWPEKELLPERRAPTFECAKEGAGNIRALLVGIDHYAMPHIDLTGSVNDATLLAGVLKRHQVAVTVAANTTRAALVSNLMSLAHDSHCGDSVIFFFGGHAHSFGDSGLHMIMSDITASQFVNEAYVPFAIAGSPSNREGRRIPGTLDTSELLDYFDRLRENGINVLYIADYTQAQDMARRMGNDFANWHATHKGAVADLAQPAKGAYFGIYAGTQEAEIKLPPGDKHGLSHGLLAWSVASALSEPGNPTFLNFTESIAAVYARTFTDTGISGNKSEFEPVFESSHPDRSPFATGLPTGNGAGESRLRNVDTRSVEVMKPALQRGVARVGPGTVLIQGRVVSPTPPIRVTVNQTSGQVYADGTYQITVPVVAGENSIPLMVWWSDSDFVAHFFTVISQNGENIVQEGQRYAVLIGNQHYQDHGFQALDTPIADSHAVATLLEKRYGFLTSAMIGDQRVSLILDDAGRETMLKTLSQLRAVIGPGDSLLIYYGGHGVYEKETDRAYWLPVDATRDAPQDWVSDADITAALARLSARHVLVVADSCYAGAFRHRGVDPEQPTMNRVQFLDEVNLRKSRNFISSGASEPVADGGGKGHSVFAQALLAGLSQETKPFTAGELFGKHIQTVVGGSSQQIPQFFPMKEGHEGGEFVFVPMLAK